MRKLKRHIWLVIITIVLITSCELEETNINPNDPLDVPMELLLPPAQEAMVEVSSENAAVFAGIFAQYFIGVDNQAVPVEAYLLDESFNMNPVWSDFYVTPLNTFNQIINKATEEGSPHYSGIAKIQMAYTMGLATSLWGDIPFSEAFSGASNLNPTYDSQESIYASIQSMLDEAIEDLNAAESVFSPGNDDLFFNGNLESWKMVAYGLKARFHMHLIKKDGNASQKAIDALENTFTSTTEELKYTYGFTAADQNPWFTYFQSTPYVEVDDFFKDLITSDPRRDHLIKTVFGISRVGDFYAGEFASVPLLSYSEILFLRAEALHRSGGAGSEDALQLAMTTHIEQVTNGDISADSIQNFIQEVAVFSGDFETDLELILNQKYISHFTQIEGWTDYRRTGYPELPINTGGTNPQNPNGEIPRRFIYPQNERLYNGSFPAQNPNLQDRFWWDL